MADSATNNLTQIGKKQKQSYISNETWNVIEERNACRANVDTDKEKDLNKQIKKKADADKLSYTINKLQQGIHLKEKWQGIKDGTSKFVPTFYQW